MPVSKAEAFYRSLIEAISPSRFSSYQIGSGTDGVQPGIAEYLWNIGLSESLYPALQGVEITLRNSIHDAVRQDGGVDDWFAYMLAGRELESVTAEKRRMSNQGKIIRPDDLVASLSFGFWVGLFHSRYEQILWPKLLVEVFPNIPRELRTRNSIFRKLEQIRRLRNRVFHHEPIWHWHDLEQRHREMLEVISWINREMLSVVEAIDRFTEVYQQGPDQYRKDLLRLGGPGA